MSAEIIVDAEAVDCRIRENARSFVQFGVDLIRMRDNQLYRHLPNPCDSFAEYVRTVEDLSERRTREIISASLVYRAIEGGEECARPPATAYQCRALIDADLVTFKTEERMVTNSNGTPQKVRQPVEVKNAKALATAWEKSCKAYDEHADQYREDNDGKEPRPMSYTFIRKQFPGGEMMERSKDTSKFAAFGRALSACTRTLRDVRNKHGGNATGLLEAEGWTEEHRNSMAELIHAAVTELDIWGEAVSDD